MILIHIEKVIINEESREIILGCSCGWQRQLGLNAGPGSTYADSSAWASHFDFEARTSPYL